MEILAPAGDFEMLIAAVRAGADAVYLGVSGFNARSGAFGFGGEELAQAASYCHIRGVKAYAAINTLVFPSEWPKAMEAMAMIASSGADAAIVQDWGVARALKACCPDLPLHASTQASVHSLEGAIAAYSMGFSRVILSRELSLTEIGAIANKSPIPVEVFIHGSLCYSVSGQCYMSSFLGGRSANRGNCAGPCRMPYKLSLGGGGECPLSLKDLSALPMAKELENLGVASIKIEGRLKGPEYAASAVDASIKALRGEEYDSGFLSEVFSHAGFTNGWMDGANKGMFGSRGLGQLEDSKRAMPKARGLYRIERQSVPVSLELSHENGRASLEAYDGANKAKVYSKGGLTKGQADLGLIEKALKKAGGTPFLVTQANMSLDGMAISAQEASQMRREALETLASERGRVAPWAFMSADSDTGHKSPKEAIGPIGVFRSLGQLDRGLWESFGEIIIPLSQRGGSPKEFSHKTRLLMPRFMPPGKEGQCFDEAADAIAKGCQKFHAQSLSALSMLSKLGADVSCGWALNCTNIESAKALFGLGASSVCLSPELKLTEAMKITEALPDSSFAYIYYGCLPLMLSRACPVGQSRGCDGCPKEWGLKGQKGPEFRALCSEGAVEIFNPIPLWAGGLNAPIGASKLFLFSFEGPSGAKAALKSAGGAKAPFAFTRGLYKTGPIAPSN